MIRRFFFALFLFFAGPLAEATPLERQELSPQYSYTGGPVRLALFDADSTIRISTGHYFAPASAAEVRVLPNVPEAILALNRRGYLVAIMTNQSNMIMRVGEANVLAGVRETIRQVEAAGGKVHYFDYSTTAEESKPHPTMGERLARHVRERLGAGSQIDWKNSFMVGDAAYLKAHGDVLAEIRPDGTLGFDHGNFDRHFAGNLGIKFYEPDEFFGWRANQVHRIHRLPQLEEYLAANPPRGPIRRYGCEGAYSIFGANGGPGIAGKLPYLR